MATDDDIDILAAFRDSFDEEPPADYMPQPDLPEEPDGEPADLWATSNDESGKGRPKDRVGETFAKGKRDNSKRTNAIVAAAAGISDRTTRTANGRVPTDEDLANWTPHGLDAPKQKRQRKAKTKRKPNTTLPPHAIAHVFSEAGRTDATNAQRFARRHVDAVRWCEQWRTWLIWDGTRWAHDNTCAVVALAKEVWRELWGELGSDEAANVPDLEPIVKWCQYTASSRGIRAMLDLTKPDLAVTPEQFDRDPWLLNCPNGTLELRTGELREHRREDYLTKLCPTEYQAQAKCPKWTNFLEAILPDAAMRTYLQRLGGYWLSGDVREQILPLFWGTGSNGKSTLIESLKAIVGKDYWIAGDKSLVIARKNEGGHSTERMDLFGRRLAIVTETEEGQQFAEAFVKQMTGGDTYRGRHVYEKTWEFSPTHKVVLVTNHKPRVRGTDHAFWRRTKLVEFGVTIPDDRQDKNLKEKLAAEATGILAWCVAGCAAWLADGDLAEPDSVRRATAQYRDAEDLLAQFLGDCCVIGADKSVKLKTLRAAYEAWCKERGDHEVSGRRFGSYLKDQGYESYTNNGTWYRGIGVVEQPKDTAETDQEGLAKW